MANKPPSLRALSRNPNVRRAFLIVAALVGVYLLLRSRGSTSSPHVESDPRGEKYVRKCLARLGGSHDDNKDKTNKIAGSCPKEPPKHLVDGYTMGGKIEIVNEWKCQTGPEYDKAHAYTKEDIDEKVEKARQRISDFYGQTDQWLYRALDHYSIKDKHVVIMGSQRPVYEAICLVFGGSNCTTIDFQPITIPKYDRYTTMTLDQYDAHPQSFDASFSISTFEHDGLGRYGDPLRVNGDLEMMKKMKCILKPDGLMFLSVPISKDKVVWNMHRLYGQIRLPLLLEEWTILGIFADPSIFPRWSGCDCGTQGDYEPIFVLQNSTPKPGANIAKLNEYLLKDYRVGTPCK